MSYYYTSGRYSASKPIVWDARYDGSYSGRDSSTDSRASRYTTSSAGYSNRCRSGYYGSSGQRTYEDSKQKYRASDNSELPSAKHHTIVHTNNNPAADFQYATTTRGDKVDTTHYNKPRYDAAEPRSSDATSSHYKTSQSRSSGSKSSSSSHKHKHK